MTVGLLASIIRADPHASHALRGSQHILSHNCCTVVAQRSISPSRATSVRVFADSLAHGSAGFDTGPGQGRRERD